MEVALTDLPKIAPSKGTVFFMAVFLAAFSYFFTRSDSQPKHARCSDKK